MSTKNNAPAGNEGAETGLVNQDHDTPTEAQIRAAVAGYAVLVETGEGRYRRRLFLTLASAERAVNRARERGRYAHLVLVTLTPTAVIQ